MAKTKRRSIQDPSAPLTFELEKGTRVAFVLTAASELQKIGDGSFGAVFLGLNQMDDSPVAIKVLYDTPTLKRRATRIEPDSVIEPLKAAGFSTERAEALRKFMEKRDERSLSKLVIALYEHKAELFGGQHEYWNKALERLEFDSLAIERFEQEMRLSSFLKSKLPLGTLSSLVNVIGGTRQFLRSPAGQALTPEFRRLGITPSNFVVVMDLYETNLERLLVYGPETVQLSAPKFAVRREAFRDGFTDEQRRELSAQLTARTEEELAEKIKAAALDNNLRKRLRENVYVRVGYELLRVMNFEDRIRTLLPILKDIVNGLLPLHRFGLFHLDLKPANIFLRRKADGELQVAIGDLGYLETPTTERSGSFYAVDPQAELALGSLHYRSPEQRDFFDACDASVQVNDDGRIELVVHDPKFRSTFIEKGDAVVFSKDPHRNRYLIAENVQIARDADQPSRVVLAAHPDQDILRANDQTQVFFYKTPNLRTDLFGVGALAYTLLTGGESAEHFYDHIRRFESGANGAPGRIPDVVDSYGRVSTFVEDDRGLTTAFESLFDPYRRVYAPLEIVELILRCMMYKAEGTYYHTARSQEADFEGREDKSAAATVLSRDIARLMQLERFAPSANNPLLSLDTQLANAAGSVSLLETIDGYKAYSLDPDISAPLRLRLANGVWLLRRITDFVQKCVEDPGGKDFGLVQVLPKSLQVRSLSALGEVAALNPTVYKRLDDYLKDMVRDELRAKLSRDVANPYVPDSFVSMRRMIQLVAISRVSAAPEKPQFRYTLEGSSPFARNTVDGWVLVDDRLLRVKSLTTTEGLSNRLLEAEARTPDDAKPLDLLKDGVRYVYYEQIDVGCYYLEMLGLYAYHLLFAELPQFSLRSDKPANQVLRRGATSITVPKIPPPQSSVPWLKEKDHRARHQSALQSVFAYAAYLYAALTFHDLDGSFYQRGPDNPNRLRAVISEIRQLQDKVTQFLRLADATELERPTPKPEALPVTQEELELDAAYSGNFEALVQGILGLSRKQ